MRRLRIAVSMIVILASLASVQVVFGALYYAGNHITSVYGGKATIGTPPSKPYMPSDGQLQSWVLRR